MDIYGLIGFPLTHSFSKKYFTEKFEKENIPNSRYDLFEIEKISLFPDIIKKTPGLKGLNITIPYKEAIIPYLDKLDDAAKIIGAVNVIKVSDKGLVGYNSDYYGFKKSLENFLPPDLKSFKALVLGTGGAAKAVVAVLSDLGISFKIVSRNVATASLTGQLHYDQINEACLNTYKLIINTTPAGMYPNINTAPPIPYEYLTAGHYLFDLVYNPEETLFLSRGKNAGARTKAGLEMLYLQAEKAWEFWNRAE